MRESAIGPDLSHRRNLIQAMVTSGRAAGSDRAKSPRGSASRRRRPRAGRASSRGRSRPTSAIRSCARWSSCSRGCGAASTIGVDVHHGKRAREGRARQGARLSAQSSQPHRLPAAVVLSSTRRDSRRRTSPRAPISIFRSWVRCCGAAARFFLRRSFKRRAAVRGGVPRVPARDAGQGLSDRVLHRGWQEPQRAHAARRRAGSSA